MNILGQKMMVKSGIDFFYFEIERAPSELLQPNVKKNHPIKAGLAGISDGAGSILK